LLDVLAESVAAPRPVQSLKDLRLGVPRNVVLDGLEPHVAESFEDALRTLSANGASIEEFDFPLLDQLGPLLAKGGLSAAESFAWHRRRGFPATSGEYDHRVAFRIAKGAEQSAADYLDLLNTRQRLIAANSSDSSPYAALLFPTTPIVAPARSAVAEDAEFYRLNGLALRNPAIVNLLDGCAISIPCQREGTAPVGLMIVGRTGQDERLLGIAAAIEAAIAR
jgi:aspartyl-tRNA(Asn)/glutamyl-tRNA(Gln) amidotransferase subunit A